MAFYSNMVKWNVLTELVIKRQVPPQEVPRDVYLNQRLRIEDKWPLVETLDLLYHRLYKRGIDVAFIAVGSSTFDAYYWEKRIGLTVWDRFLGKQAERKYDDIDVRMLIEQESSVMEMNRLIYKQKKLHDETCVILSSQGYVIEDHSDTSQDMKYGHYSITTMLRSETRLDLLIGYASTHIKEDNTSYKPDKLSPEKVIQKQMEIVGTGNPFSVLYPSHAMNNAMK